MTTSLTSDSSAPVDVGRCGGGALQSPTPETKKNQLVGLALALVLRTAAHSTPSPPLLTRLFDQRHDRQFDVGIEVEHGTLTGGLTGATLASATE